MGSINYDRIGADICAALDAAKAQGLVAQPETLVTLERIHVPRARHERLIEAVEKSGLQCRPLVSNAYALVLRHDADRGSGRSVRVLHDQSASETVRRVLLDLGWREEIVPRTLMRCLQPPCD